MTADHTTLDFLLTRRSRPPRTLCAPAPDRAQLDRILQAATRVPDHGKLEPWRLIVLGPNARAKLKAQAADHAAGMEDSVAAKGIAQFDSPLIVAVIAAPKASDRIPRIEQTLSVGAVCVSLVNAALASGFGAAWLTGWPALDRDFAAPAFDLGTDEWVAGLIHIGTDTGRPPERPRPDLGAITEWRD